MDAINKLFKKLPFKTNAGNTQLVISSVSGVVLLYVLWNKMSEAKKADKSNEMKWSGKFVAGSILVLLTALSVYVSAYHIDCVILGDCDTFAWILVALSVLNIFSIYNGVTESF